jgi:hypothetical protein
MTNQIVSIDTLRTQLAAKLAAQQSTLPPPTSTRIKMTREGLQTPDGRVHPALEVVVVDYRFVNTWYDKRYVPGQMESPACWALSGDYAAMAPDESSDKPQHATCEGCPKNEWGSAGGGSKGKACSNKMRIAVCTPDATSDSPVYTIDLPPTSSGGFIAEMRKLSVPIQTVVFELKQDSKVDYPKVVSKVIRPIDEGLAPHLMPLIDKAKELVGRGYDYDA